MRYNFEKCESVVAVSGELMFSDHTAFRAMAERLLKSESRPLAIDLSQLTFIDSAGLGLLLIARDEAGKTNRELVLRNPVGQVKRMFDIAKFETLFTIQN